MFSKFLIFITLVTRLKLLGADPIIRLPYGQILGRKATTFKNKPYVAFEGIPYATPPTGKLRFQPPQPVGKWDGILDTTSLETSCFQVSRDIDEESEDCLYLNVFTPQLPNKSGNKTFPVLFYIHGGGFIGGSSINSSPDLFINSDLILVTINYRLGIFGFTSTEDEVIPGNNGLKDQQLALKWTHNNIALFGGDPNQITIFGQSAGSASCAYQLLNQDNDGLLQAAILESGTFLSPWTYQRQARQVAFTTASYLNSSFKTNNDSKALLEFLISVDAKALDEASAQYRNMKDESDYLEITQGFYWAPVIEVKNPNAFLAEKQYKLLKNGKFLKVPVMIGITSEEGLAFNTDVDVMEKILKDYDEHPEWVVPNNMQINEDDQKRNMGLAIRDLYTGGKPWVYHLSNGVRYFSDMSFTRSIIKHAELSSQFVPTYFYQFSYYGEMGDWNTLYDGAEKVQHGADLKYLFCSEADCNDGTFPEADRITRRRLVKLWTDFAKYKNPTPQVSELLQNVTWPTVSSDRSDFIYLDIGENLEIKRSPKKETYAKWIQLYNNLNYNDFDTF